MALIRITRELVFEILGNGLALPERIRDVFLQEGGGPSLPTTLEIKTDLEGFGETEHALLVFERDYTGATTLVRIDHVE